MNTLKKLKVTALFGTMVALFAWGCDISPDAGTGTGTMQVKMHDNPAHYDEVNVSVERVEVNRSEGDQGWQTISEPNEVYNILELVNGEFAVLADAELETGTYQQIRLILDDNNSIVIDGESFPLTVPSGAQTGLKLNINAEIEEGVIYTLLLDFDADRSVVKRGMQDHYNLRPVIRATAEAESGNIGGSVNAESTVRAILDAGTAEADTVSTTFSDSETGEFLLVGLEENSYTVNFEPADEEAYEGTEIDDVEVILGETTDLGEIELTEIDDEQDE